MARLSFDGVTKHFGDITAVDDLTLHVADGELLVLLGSSGCGKTTALRMAAGLEELNDGTISIGDRVVHRQLVRSHSGRRQGAGAPTCSTPRSRCSPRACSRPRR